nr:oligosaccharide flippase family protein [Methylobacterium soli]
MILEVLSGSVFSSIGLILIASLIGTASLGTAAIALAIAQTINFFPDTLFDEAIVQRRRLERRHLGSAFWIVTGLAVILGAAMGLTSGFVARLYGQAEIAPLLLALAPVPICSAVVSVQCARLRRTLRLRTLTICTAIARACATSLGIGLAIGGYGSWAAVAQFGFAPAMLAILLGANSDWRFVGSVSRRHAIEISRFASVRTVAHFVEATRNQFFFMILGYYVSPQVLGQVSLAFRLIDSLTRIICTALVRLLLPLLSRMQHDRTALPGFFLAASRATAAIFMPPFVVLALMGGDLGHLVANTDWQGLAQLVPWLSIAGLFLVIEIPAHTAILAIGRPALLSFAALGGLAFLLLQIVVFAPATGVGAVLCWLTAVVARAPAQFLMTRLVLGIPLRSQLAAYWPALMITGAVLVPVLTIAHWTLRHGYSDVFVVALKLLACACIYLASIALLLRAQRGTGSLPNTPGVRA